MYFLALGLAFLALKLSGLGPVERWPWWAVLTPFGLAVLWWAWADATGYTRRVAMEREERRRQARIARAQAPTGQTPRTPPPPGGAPRA